jgi:hypothetical protein
VLLHGTEAEGGGRRRDQGPCGHLEPASGLLGRIQLPTTGRQLGGVVGQIGCHTNLLSAAIRAGVIPLNYTSKSPVAAIIRSGRQEGIKNALLLSIGAGAPLVSAMVPGFPPAFS